MRFAALVHDGAPRLGLVERDAIRLLPSALTNVSDYLALSHADRAELAPETAMPLDLTTLRAPVRPKKNIFCVGRNYMGHAEEIARARNVPLNLPSVPTFFTKAPTAVADPGATLHFSPEISQQYDFEAELAVVIGERCRDVSEGTALDVVFGYTCLNDLTARDLQKDHGQWFKGKSLDESCPIGPWVVTADELGDPQSLAITLRLDGETMQSSNTSQMIFDVRRIIASLSRGMTLEPGDVIATGTPDGVGFARTPPVFLRDGVTMRIEIARIGTLENRVAFAAPAAR